MKTIKTKSYKSLLKHANSVNNMIKILWSYFPDHSSSCYQLRQILLDNEYPSPSIELISSCLDEISYDMSLRQNSSSSSSQDMRNLQDLSIDLINFSKFLKQYRSDYLPCMQCGTISHIDELNNPHHFCSHCLQKMEKHLQDIKKLRPV